MSEEIKTAKTTAPADTDSHADVGKMVKELNGAEFTDGGSVTHADAEATAAKPQTREQNAANARRRRAEEQRAEIRRAEQAAREKGIIEALGGKNPYTGEEMHDSTDVEEFLTMREIEVNNGDPLSDYSKYRKKKERERAEQEAAEEQSREWYKNDYAAFVKQNPDVSLDMLAADELFQRFMQGRIGTVPLAEAYADYNAIVEASERRARDKEARRIANGTASPGALSGGGGSTGAYFTKAQVERMSKAEVSKNYDAIRNSMAKWN